ncbi:MAG: aspartate--tRNA(Asn) ligase [Candidatus Undinarchaeales archaeon]
MTLDNLNDWRKSHYADEVKPDLDGKKVTLMGWAREIRPHGKLAFIVLADRGGDTQLIIKDSKLVEKAETLNREDVIAVKGKVQKTDKSKRGVEVLVSDLKVLNKSKTPLPLDVDEKTPADLDTRLNSRVLDLRKPKNVAVFKIRDKILTSAREYLEKGGFIEIETPKIIAAATEGGADLFSVEYFEEKAYLRQSPQIYKELMTSCFEKVYEIGPVFRAEPSDTSQHLAEIVQMDIEMGFSDEKDTWKVLEGIMEHVYEKVRKDCNSELKTLGRKIDKLKTPFKKISYSEVIDELDLNFGDDIPPEGEEKISEMYGKPAIVYEWPMDLKAYYIHPKDEKLSYGFDLIHEGVEIASGGRRIHDPELYMKMVEKKGLNPDNFKDTAEFYKLGMPPHAGWAIGLDRLTMAITGVENIREAVLFPRDLKRLHP